MSRDFALVVMVMPCGLIPVEGIDFVDWFYFSCMHVPMCGPHKHTHTQTNVQYGAFEEWSLLTEPQHQPVKNIAIPEKTVCPHPEDVAKEGEMHFYNTVRSARKMLKHLTHPNWTHRDRLWETEGFYSQQQSSTQFTSVLTSQVYGCN